LSLTEVNRVKSYGGRVKIDPDRNNTPNVAGPQEVDAWKRGGIIIPVRVPVGREGGERKKSTRPGQLLGTFPSAHT